MLLKFIHYLFLILKEIIYSPNVVKNKFNEEQFNIFETADTKSNYLNYVEKYDNYESDEVHDNDFID